ncbi:NAD(P)/FAD-dependent oxidoreductase [Microbacterium capsulatum]|uniref:NAD(P)/FAD-dependent oxidoreductase n=1 Tax=Microbacterium capsulatum TaxID=3041921 RepID=A0ABU0XEX6_9MICO|nr:NAD(P)/FAD-dependent oxidoreductase [Microbacterium sp. ASV81]MDQ4213674.1 NAD(P)/FAD-dependent oxidoreductase [Microbacterium sp. ASV81]
MSDSTTVHDIVVVGAGYAGIYTTIHAAQAGLDVIGLEAGADIGGTWYWNRFPGARCDVESIDYSYSFDKDLQRQWRWSERYATQPEILRYLSHVADRHDVRRHYRFSQRVSQARWDEDAQVWTVRTEQGLETSARWLVMASGCLSTPILPDLPGRESFAGDVYQTAAWPHEHPDFTGKRVAVIGSGASAVQSVPIFAESAAEVVVYQRTANYSVPAFNRPLTDEDWRAAQEDYDHRRELSWNGLAGSPWTSHPVPYDEVPEEEREAIFEEAWLRGGVLFAKAFQGLTARQEINDAAREFFERKLAEIVEDPQTLADLTPHGYAIGTKRICTDSGYYRSFNLPHVSLVNLRRDPIVEVGPSGIRTESGLREFDVIVYATGFDAMTGALTHIDIHGRDGILLRDAWAEGAVNYLGIGVPGFPNLLTLNSAGSPSVLSNMALTSEQQGDYALRLIAHCAAQGFTSAEVRADAAQAWIEHGAEVASGSLFSKTDSWYSGANIAGKARGFLPYIGGFRPYIDRVDRIADEGYTGFVLSTRTAVPA